MLSSREEDKMRKHACASYQALNIGARKPASILAMLVPIKATDKSTVQQCQYPMTAAYGFTDYRSQGQTISHMVVNIATPPIGRLSLFNLYITLSHSSGRATIRLLCDFNNKPFQVLHSPNLLAKDERPEELDRNTREWRQKMGWCRQESTSEIVAHT